MATQVFDVDGTPRDLADNAVLHEDYFEIILASAGGPPGEVSL